MSESAGGVGINASFVKYVVKVDSKGDPSVSDQACCRNFRLNQSSETYEYRLIAADTVDMAFLVLETKKRAINTVVMGKQNLFIPTDIDQDEVIEKKGNIAYYLRPGVVNKWETEDSAWSVNVGYNRFDDPLLCQPKGAQYSS